MTERGLNLTPGRRVRAAMQLAGIESFGELARIIDTRNLGERTLRKIADDSDTSRTMQRLDAIAIAQATGLPLGFFVLPADQLLAAIESAGEGGTEQPSPAELAARLESVEAALSRVLEAVPIPEPPVGLLPRREADETTPEERRPPDTAVGDSQPGSGRS